MKLGALFLSLTCSAIMSSNVFAGGSDTTDTTIKDVQWTLYSIVNTTKKSSYDRYVYNFENNQLVGKKMGALEYEKTNLINKIYHQDYLAIYSEDSGRWAYKVHGIGIKPLSWTLSVDEPHDENTGSFTINFEEINLSGKSIGEYLAPFEYSLNMRNPRPYHNEEWANFKNKIGKASFPKGSVCLKTIIDKNISEIAPLAPIVAVDRNIKDFHLVKNGIIQMFSEDFYNAVSDNTDLSKEAQLTKFILDQETIVCDYFNGIASGAIEEILN